MATSFPIGKQALVVRTKRLCGCSKSFDFRQQSKLLMVVRKSHFETFCNKKRKKSIGAKIEKVLPLLVAEVLLLPLLLLPNLKVKAVYLCVCVLEKNLGGC